MLARLPKRCCRRVLGWGTLLVGGVLMVLGGGCLGTRAERVDETAPPVVRAELSYATGSPLAAPARLDVNDLQVEEVLRLQVEIYALSDVPVAALDDVQDQIRRSPERCVRHHGVFDRLIGQ